MADPGSGGAIPPVPRRVVLGAGVVALAGLGAFAYVQRRSRAMRFAGCSVAARVRGGALGGPFELTGPGGARVTDADLLARGPALISFGRSASVASVAIVRRNAAAAAILEGEGVTVTPVFVALDGAEGVSMPGGADGPAPRPVTLSGSPGRIATLAKAFRLPDVPSLSYLVVAGRGTVAVFPERLDPGTVADQASCFIAAAAR